MQILPKLQEILQENKTTLENMAQMDAVQDYMKKNPWKVDEGALHAYIDTLVKRSSRTIKTTSIVSVTNNGQDVLHTDVEDRCNIIAYLRSNKEHYPRVKKQSQDTLSSMVDPVKVQQKRETLHPGFRKLCGLRGSKLSGGQK